MINCSNNLTRARKRASTNASSSSSKTPTFSHEHHNQHQRAREGGVSGGGGDVCQLILAEGSGLACRTQSDREKKTEHVELERDSRVQIKSTGAVLLVLLPV